MVFLHYFYTKGNTDLIANESHTGANSTLENFIK